MSAFLTTSRLDAAWSLKIFNSKILWNFIVIAFAVKTCLALQTSLQPREAAGSNARLVFAHFIAGLTINFTREDWKNQISLAASHEIDAFALNVGAPASWQVDQVSAAYEVASEIKTSSGKPFKLFLSLDMTVIQSASEVSQWVTTFIPASSQLLVDGRPLISTFAGEDKNLGGGTLSDGWKAAVKEPLLSLVPPINPLFVPAWTSLDPMHAVSNNAVVDGIMTWLSWPTGTEQMSTKVDLQFQKDAQDSKKLYMAGVSPCFFTHYPEKNYLFRSDDHLYINRWKELIAMPRPPDFVQIISWNDYGESHYIGDLNSGQQPDGTTWVDAFDHQAWLFMTDYFIKWYKAGSPPEITDEQVYFHYRPHSVNAVASSDPLGPPGNATSTTDAIYISTFLPLDSAARQLSVSVGDNPPQTFKDLPLGNIGTFSAPWTGAGGGVKVELLDSAGKKLLAGEGKIKINNKISAYNFNYAHVMLANGVQDKVKTLGSTSASNSAAGFSPKSINGVNSSGAFKYSLLSALAMVHLSVICFILPHF